MGWYVNVILPTNIWSSTNFNVSLTVFIITLSNLRALPLLVLVLSPLLPCTRYTVSGTLYQVHCTFISVRLESRLAQPSLQAATSVKSIPSKPPTTTMHTNSHWLGMIWFNVLSTVTNCILFAFSSPPTTLTHPFPHSFIPILRCCPWQGEERVPCHKEDVNLPGGLRHLRLQDQARVH